jgi:hypothetical protein
MKASGSFQFASLSWTMMQKDSSKALRAVLRILTEAGDLLQVHPVLAKRALQELYEKADERTAKERADLVSRVSFLWRTSDTPERRYVEELAAAFKCTVQQAQAHLQTLWDYQNTLNPVEAFQRRALGVASTNTIPQSDFAVYWRALRGLSRSECRDVLRDLTRLSEQLGCDLSEALAEHSKRGKQWWFTPFLHRLAVQAGHYYETSVDDPRRSTGAYLENLTQEEANILLAHETRLDGNPWLEAERQALQRVLRREPDRDAHYDRMPPITAWHELCALAGWDNPYESVIENPLLISNMLYELEGLGQKQHIAGLCRAAQLAVYDPPMTGLAQRLGLGDRSSSQEVQQKLEDLTAFELRDVSRAITPLKISVEKTLRLEGVDINPNSHTFVPPPDPSDRVPPLTELSAKAIGRIGSWQYLTRLCGLHHLSGTRGAAARNELATALVDRYRDGMDRSIELLAYQALVLPRVRAQYAARDRQQLASEHKRAVEHQL